MKAQLENFLVHAVAFLLVFSVTGGPLLAVIYSINRHEENKQKTYLEMQNKGEGVVIDRVFYSHATINSEIAKWTTIDEMNKKPHNEKDGITIDQYFYSNQEIALTLAKLATIKKLNEENTAKIMSKN